ncbi:MAG: nitroreductase family protein [Victivallales bacterium]|nr:nitroreductase family protein [Victivallales bacterium]
MDIEDKIMTLEQAVAWHGKLKAEGRKLVATNGVFDLLHRGHAEYLAKAAQAGDALLVAINSDESVRRIKGPSRPIVTEGDRAYLLACMSFVDAVVIFPEDTATNTLAAVRPEIYAKGGDYTEETLVREEYFVMKEFVEKFVFIPFVAGRSTTSTIRKVNGGAMGESAEATDSGLNPKLNLLYGRRSVRQYQKRPVGDDLVQELLKAAMAAPSACCKDPWHFIVLKKEETRRQVAALLKNGGFLADAPMGFVVCGDLTKAHGGELSYLLQDCSAATENLLLAAHGLSLGGCWLGVHPRLERVEGIRRLLDLPDTMIPVAAVAIGWPAQDLKIRTRFRKDAVTER